MLVCSVVVLVFCCIVALLRRRVGLLLCCFDVAVLFLFCLFAVLSC